MTLKWVKRVQDKSKTKTRQKDRSDFTESTYANEKMVPTKGKTKKPFVSRMSIFYKKDGLH